MKSLLVIISLIIALTQFAICEKWQPKGYAYVVGYTYDCTKDPLGQSIILKDGSLHDGVIRAVTIRLNKRQISSLWEHLRERPEGDEEFEEADCHDPHHAFVFYDLGWKPIAWINICYLCGNTSTDTRGSNPRIDLKPLERFCKKLGMPIFEDDAGYTNLYKAEQGVAPNH
ncbi:hypothetical protein [Rubritalea sp.]|uniref:hypothetical protein n=1 Tax=Rubritalea sp. TaxID=2109375 RepID=UPI003EF8F839